MQVAHPSHLLTYSVQLGKPLRYAVELSDASLTFCMKLYHSPVRFRLRVGHPFTNSPSKPPPMKLEPDLLEAKHWIYPLNKPKRDYQFNIVKHCLFENTLVALPTGLGKTFIAGVIMLNCMFNLIEHHIHTSFAEFRTNLQTIGGFRKARSFSWRPRSLL